MILLMLLALLITGLISLLHFKNENELYHRERLQRKEVSIMESINYFLRNANVGGSPDSLVRKFDTKICEIADINNLDVNIFSLQGDLLITSNSTLFESRILEEKLATSILKSMGEAEDQLMVISSTDTLEYLSTYTYINDADDNPIALLNLPYFNTNEILKEEVKEFLVQLVEIYLILFLLTGLIAYFLSNYITGSLQKISNMFGTTNISNDRPPISWKYNDEIGALIEAYNQMLGELQKSAVKLAQTERESAWREMAKQVAHEIKNPLTPMRLNVQYLEKSLPTDSPQKLKEFSDSMIAQIDTLSGIAEAFSRFANMPSLRKQKVDAVSLIQRSIDLFPNQDISFTKKGGLEEIDADKEQLIRVLNNLINNAIQSVGSDKSPVIEIVLDENDENLIIVVSDNGSGIPEEQKNKIFEPQFTTKNNGMGLGLAMVKNIMNSHKGKIYFKSRESGGTSFFIELPK